MRGKQAFQAVSLLLRPWGLSIGPPSQLLSIVIDQAHGASSKRQLACDDAYVLPSATSEAWASIPRVSLS